jgi:hypothetical protein
VRAFSNSGILDLWERGIGLHPVDRNLLALGAALPETPYEDLADWPLGRRNRALAELLFSFFRPELQGWVACPQCNEKLEFQMDGRTLIGQEGTGPEGPIAVNGRLFRLPNSRDLARAVREPDAALAALRLLESCWLEGESPSEDDVDEVGEKLALADPLAEIRLTFHCPNCSHEWEETLDLGEFVWAKIESLAKRLLREVHALGTAYGWTENEILSLSEPRRSLYLQMVEA